jgi:hypothetical protein
VTSGCIIQAGGQQFGAPCCKKTQLSSVGIMLHDCTGSSTENRTQTHGKINGFALPHIILMYIQCNLMHLIRGIGIDFCSCQKCLILKALKHQEKVL